MPRPRKSDEPKNKTEIWKQFQKSVKTMAEEMGIPEKRFELNLVRERSGKKSDAWKYHEKKTAQVFNSVGFSKAYRVLRGDDIGVSDIDVRIPEVPTALVDCKYRQDGWSHHTIFAECEKKYCANPEDFLVLPTKAGNETGALATVRLEVLADLMASKFLSKERPTDTLGCPRCSSIVKVSLISLNLAECVCEICSLAFIIKQEEIPNSSEDAPKKPARRTSSRRKGII
jgi:hypothetical protein